MSFKRFLFNILLYMMIFSFVCMITKSIVLPVDTVYLFVSLLVVACSIMLYEPVLRFLTVKRNFLTQWVMSSVFVFISIYLLNSLMPMFTVQTFATKSEFLQLALSGTMTMVFVSILTGFVCSLFTILKD